VRNGKSIPNVTGKTWGQQASGSRWPCDLRCGSAAALLLGLPIWIPLTTWMFVSCVCCVLCRWSLRRTGLPFRGGIPGLYVIYWPQKWEGLGPIWVVSLQKKSEVTEYKQDNNIKIGFLGEKRTEDANSANLVQYRTQRRIVIKRCTLIWGTVTNGYKHRN